MRLRALLFTTVLIFSATLWDARAQQSHPAPGSSSLSVRLKGADGKTYDLAGMRGQVLLVSFGATWCQPCKDELKALEQLQKEYRDKPVKFLWVSIEGEEEVSDKDLREYARKVKFSFPVLRDPERTFFARYATRMRLPTILFFDKVGHLSPPSHVGMSGVEQYLAKMRSRLDNLLAAPATSGRAGGN